MGRTDWTDNSKLEEKFKPNGCNKIVVEWNQEVFSLKERIGQTLHEDLMQHRIFVDFHFATNETKKLLLENLHRFIDKMYSVEGKEQDNETNRK